MAPPSKSNHVRAEPSQAENLSTVFITGACVMVIEVLGTRVIGPAFGVSLFVWSALLAVTLGALAAGYYLGGTLVDRRPHVTTLNAAVLLSGLVLALAPLARRHVLTATQGLGPRVGPLLSAALLFAPALVALGSIGPISARLASDGVSSAGRQVGSIFAVSTAGSLCGTFLVGFWLIPTFDTDHILIGTAVVLTTLGALPLAARWRKWTVTAACVPLLAGLSPKGSVPEGYEIVDSKQSLYGLVEVIDDHTRRVRMLRVDHSIIGADLVPEYDSAFSFVYLLELVRVLHPEARSMLQLGLGTGSLPRTLERSQLSMDVVEIDPAVVKFARKYFKYKPTGEVFTEDARTFLNRTERRYDVVVHDTFTGGSTPEHLLSREVLSRIQEILKPGGLLVLNFVGGDTGPQGEANHLLGQTLQAQFRHVRAFKDGTKTARITNILYFASDTELQFERVRAVRFREPRREAARQSLFEREVSIPSGELARAITDSYNPLNRLELPIAEEHSAAMNTLLPAGVWIR